MMIIPFGDNIRKLRSERQLSQAQLAKRLGVSDSIIALYETGERLPSLSSLIELARVFGVSTDFLLGIDRFKQDVLDVSGLNSKQIQTVDSIVNEYRNLMNQISESTK